MGSKLLPAGSESQTQGIKFCGFSSPTDLPDFAGGWIVKSGRAKRFGPVELAEPNYQRQAG